MVILDGHHHFNTLKCLSLRFCPVCLVNYRSGEIGVACWRPGEKISKKEALSAGLSGKLLPQKTSRYLIPDCSLGLNVPLESLW